MLVDNDINRVGTASPVQYGNGQIGSAQDRKTPGTQGTPPSRRSKSKDRRRLFTILSILLLVTLILAAVRVTSVASGNNDQLVLKIGDQQQALIDLRQSIPISPYLFGVNVFPKVGTSSVDSVNGNFTGFMSYDPAIVDGLKNAGIKLLRFPGGSWGEDQPNQNHILSLKQLSEFSTLLYEVGADGMIQARLSNPIDATGKPVTLAERANLAGRWVDFMSNPRSDLRTGEFAHVQIHPIKFWSVGNEPDKLINPDSGTGSIFTVADYVKDFIAYSIAMHENNPTIKVFGPEISQFYGIGVGPKDSEGQLWMEGFLKGVAAYEKANQQELKKLGFNLLDGVSFHRYQFDDARTSPYLLMSSSEEWNYLLPSLRQFIRQTMGRDLPVAITEINTNPNAQVPARGQAALWWADTLGTLMNQQADYVAYFSAEGVEPPYPLFTADTSHQQTAMFRVMQLFSYLQHNLIPLQIQHDPVGVYATQDDAHQAVSLLFINKSGVNQFAEVRSLNQIFGTSPWHTQDISIGAYSMVLVTLHRGGGAEAYSFNVPTLDDAAINPLKRTVCGNKTDALGYDIPC
jgi:hypothetical protein